MEVPEFFRAGGYGLFSDKGIRFLASDLESAEAIRDYLIHAIRSEWPELHLFKGYDGTAFYEGDGAVRYFQCAITMTAGRFVAVEADDVDVIYEIASAIEDRVQMDLEA